MTRLSLSSRLPGRLFGRCRVAAAVAAACCRFPIGGAAEPAAPPPAPAPAAVAVSRVVHPPQPSRLLLEQRYRSIRLVGDDAAFRRIEEACERLVSQDLLESPLRDVAALLADRSGIAVRIDGPALDDAGLDMDTTVVTAHLADVPLKAGLREVLKGMGLECVLDEIGIVITTKEVAEQMLEPRFYPLTATTDAGQVIDVLHNAVEPNSWNVVGGSGSVDVLYGDIGRGLVVGQSQRVHEKILEMLANLDRAAWPEPQGRGPAAPVVRVYRVDDARVREDLGAKLVALCRDAAAVGAEDAARISVVGDSLVVLSGSRAVHVMAAELIAAISGRHEQAANPPVVLGGGGSF